MFVARSKAKAERLAGRSRRRRLGGLETLEPRQLLSGLVITEFMARNSNTLADEDGDFSDWIELHNSTDEPLDLGGVSLSDNAGALTKWQFNNHVLLPGEYLVVFASGKDRSVAGAEFHTSFKLSGSGEDLLLVDGMTLIDSLIDYAEQDVDVSVGRSAESGLDWVSLVSPTPGAANSAKMLPAVVFSTQSGTFVEDFDLMIDPGQVGVEVRFTLDGSVPTESSLLYEGPVVISESTQVRARAYDPGGSPGRLTTRAFTKLAGADVLDFSSNLPVLVFESFGTPLPISQAFIDGHMSVFEPDDSGRTSLTDPTTLTSHVTFRRRGSSTAENPKPNLRIELRDEGGNDRNVELLGLPKESDWVLYGPYAFDRALVRDPFMHQLQRQVGNYSPRHRFVEVFANFDGGSLAGSADYQGVYVLTEQIQLGPRRMDIAELWPSENVEPNVTGGYMIKIDGSRDPGDSFGTRRGGNFVHVEPDINTLTTQQRTYIRDYIQQTEIAIYSADPTNPVTGYPAFIDVQGWADEIIFRSLAKDADALVKSTYLYKDRNSKLSYGPVWDFDRTMGNDADDRAISPQGWRSGATDDFLRHHWWSKLFQYEDFAQDWVDRWWELRDDVLTDDNFATIIDSYAVELAEAQARNFSRWPEVAPNGGEFADGLTGWEGEIAHLKGWLRERLVWIDAQTIAPVFIDIQDGVSPGTFELTLSSGEDPIYYTLDGSDPRAPGGGIGDTAIEYSEASIVIDGSVKLVARAFDLNPPLPTFRADSTIHRWSAPVWALPTDVTNLRITEINYNPADPTDAELSTLGTLNNDDFEFIELQNIGSTLIQLQGTQFTDGLEFVFPTVGLQPAERGLVVKDTDAFALRYGTGLNVLGQFSSGSLSNGGERITLADSLGQTVLDFSYDDNEPWPTTADGTGHSLQRISITDPADQSSSWTAASPTPGSVSSSLPGDFNGDSIVDDIDIDLLFAAIVAGGNDLHYDLDGSGSPTMADVTLLVSTLLATNFGDTDLDQDIDTGDLTTAIINFTGAGSSGKTWKQGDTDGDGDVDTLDLTTAIINFSGARSRLANAQSAIGFNTDTSSTNKTASGSPAQSSRDGITTGDVSPTTQGDLDTAANAPLEIFVGRPNRLHTQCRELHLNSLERLFTSMDQ